MPVAVAQETARQLHCVDLALQAVLEKRVSAGQPEQPDPNGLEAFAREVVGEIDTIISVQGISEETSFAELVNTGISATGNFNFFKARKAGLYFLTLWQVGETLIPSKEER